MGTKDFNLWGWQRVGIILNPFRWQPLKQPFWFLIGHEEFREVRHSEVLLWCLHQNLIIRPEALLGNEPSKTWVTPLLSHYILSTDHPGSHCVSNRKHLESSCQASPSTSQAHQTSDVLLLPLWTLLLKEVVHHDAAHAMAHQNYFSPFLLVAFLNQQLEFSKVFTLLICCFSKVIGCSQKRRATNITSLHQTLNKGCKIGGESPRAFADELHGGCAAPARYPRLDPRSI